LLAAALLGGPAGEFPANIFESGKYEKTSLVQKTKKQADHGLTGGPILSTTFFPLPSPPPLVKQLHSLNKGIGIFIDAMA